MTDKQIQSLIDRYLAGETSPEEELALARALRSREEGAASSPRGSFSPSGPSSPRGSFRVCCDSVATNGEAALPEEWQAVLLMLGELAEGEAEYDAIMARRQRCIEGSSPQAAKRRRLWPAAVAAAASIAIAVLLAWPLKEQQPKGQLAQQLPASQSFPASQGADTAQPLPSHQGAGCPKGGVGAVTPPSAKKTQTPPPAPPLEGRGAAAPKNTPNSVAAAPLTSRNSIAAAPKGPRTRGATSSSRKALAQRELPDTLGQGIWQDEENVLLALQMLADCEKTIARSEQRLRNDMVEAAFTALPQPPQARLVVYDNGDYMVVDDSQPTIIEL